MTFGTVTQTSPLLVRLDGAATATAAKVIGGVTYTPTVNGRVIVSAVSGRLYVHGGA